MISKPETIYKKIPDHINIYKPIITWVPVEIVITEPAIVSGKQARAYRTDYYIHPKTGEAVTLVELRKLPDFNGTSNYEGLYLMELWGDLGSDGHIEYYLSFYKFGILPKDRPFWEMTNEDLDKIKEL